MKIFGFLTLGVVCSLTAIDAHAKSKCVSVGEISKTINPGEKLIFQASSEKHYMKSIRYISGPSICRRFNTTGPDCSYFGVQITLKTGSEEIRVLNAKTPCKLVMSMQQLVDEPEPRDPKGEQKTSQVPIIKPALAQEPSPIPKRVSTIEIRSEKSAPLLLDIDAGVSGGITRAHYQSTENTVLQPSASINASARLYLSSERERTGESVCLKGNIGKSGDRMTGGTELAFIGNREFPFTYYTRYQSDLVFSELEPLSVRFHAIDTPEEKLNVQIGSRYQYENRGFEGELGSGIQMRQIGGGVSTEVQLPESLLRATLKTNASLYYNMNSIEKAYYMGPNVGSEQGAGGYSCMVASQIELPLSESTKVYGSASYKNVNYPYHGDHKQTQELGVRLGISSEFR